MGLLLSVGLVYLGKLAIENNTKKISKDGIIGVKRR